MKRGTKSFLVAVALPFVGGIATAAATFVGWIAVAVLIWHPFRLHLRRFGMTADDIGFSYLGALGPPYVGGLFVLTTTLGLIVFLVVRDGKWCTAVIVLFNLIPGALVFLALNRALPGLHSEPLWHYPLTETVVVFVGIAWSIVFLRILKATTAQRSVP